MKEALLRAETKLAFNERRLMSDNMKPHEAVRQVCALSDEYAVSGDADWPLRQIRDHLLDFSRALCMRYKGMSGTEKAHLCRLIVFEAAKRHVEELEAADRQEYHFVIKICEQIERVRWATTN